MRVLLTGATGFVGRRVLPLLSAEGFDVVAAIYRNHLPDLLGGYVRETVECDLRDAEVLKSAVATVDAVCHLAAHIPQNYEDPDEAERCLKINSIATLELALAATKRQGSRFVHLSSSNAYSAFAGVAAEDSALYPADRATYYLTSKLAGELYVEHLRRSRGLKAITLRLSSVYGHGMQEKAVVSRFMSAASRGEQLEVWDDGIPQYDFVHVIDIAKLIVQALKGGEPGVYNAGSGKAHSVLELAETIRDGYADHGVKVVVKPAGDRIPASFPALSLEKTKRTWDYRPLSLMDGIAEYRREIEKAVLPE